MERGYRSQTPTYPRKHSPMAHLKGEPLAAIHNILTRLDAQGASLHTNSATEPTFSAVPASNVSANAITGGAAKRSPPERQMPDEAGTIFSSNITPQLPGQSLSAGPAGEVGSPGG